ncbi:EKC/KEOPS complex subunit Tprkb [Trifolium repens]|nr:EKC/KEOPS complex subunit Tprkb [Trifolium repens]
MFWNYHNTPNHDWKTLLRVSLTLANPSSLLFSNADERRLFILSSQTQRFKPQIMKLINVNGTTTLYLALYTDVTNSKELLESMQAGTLEPEVAFLNASLIPDVFPLLAAAHKTLVVKSRDSLTTRTLHSELVYNYSGSKHITESLKRCGISETTTYVLAARFDATPDEIKAIEKLVIGKEIDLEELEGRANQAQIQKHYKISASELGISSLADAITCRIAARDAL